MDWLQFISNMTSNLIWPITVLVLLLVFKNEVVKLIKRIARVKYKDLELDFEKMNQKAEALRYSVLIEPERPPKEPEGKEPQITVMDDMPVSVESTGEPLSGPTREQLRLVAQKSPSAAILLAWPGLEAALTSAASRLSIPPAPAGANSLAYNAEMIVKLRGLDPVFAAVIFDLRDLRNLIAHNPDAMLSVKQEQAENYVRTIGNLTNQLEHLQKN